MGHLLVLISTGKNQVDISPYLKPQSSQHHFTWEETNTEYVFKLKPRTSSRMRGCACSGSQVDSSFRHKMLIPEGWEAVVDNVGRIWYLHMRQYPHLSQYEPPEQEEDGVLYWREVLSLAEATVMATELAEGRPLSPMPPLLPPGWRPDNGGDGGRDNGGGDGRGGDGADDRNDDDGDDEDDDDGVDRDDDDENDGDSDDDDEDDGDGDDDDEDDGDGDDDDEDDTDGDDDGDGGDHPHSSIQYIFL